MKIYREIVRNTEMGVQSIDNLLGYVDQAKFRELMLSQQEDLRSFYDRAMNELNCEEQEQAKGGVFEKTMLKAGVNMNAMFNDSVSHMSAMLIDGYSMGIESVQKCINEMKKDGTEMPPIAGEIIKFYDKCIKALREYL